VSLILEALKKLDREKEDPERGFLVMTSERWPRPSRRLPAILIGIAAVILGVGAALALGVLKPSRGAAPSAEPTLPVTATPAAPPPSMAIATTPTQPLSSVAISPTPTQQPTVAAPALALPSVTVPARPAPPPTTPQQPEQRAVETRSPASQEPPTLVLQAVSERDGQPIALLSDRLVREGDEFDGVKVVRIGETEVEVEWNGRRLFVRF
jgi:hypothetical protein